MSKLSAQVDELRSMAESVGLAMPQAATLMMEAADAIDRLDAENAKGGRMSAPILKSYVDERGNISVRVSRDVQVLTREEADRIEAKYKRLQAENAKLLEIIADLEELLPKSERRYIHETAKAIAEDNAKLRELVRDMFAVISDRNSWWDCMCKDTRRFTDRMRELGVEA